MLFEALLYRKATSLGIVSGIIAGLVAITPAAGVVRPGGAIVIGAVSAIFCFLAIQLKNRAGYDASLDAFGIHGVGGIVGALVLTFFIRESWMADAAAAAGGSWSVWQQFGIQAAAVGITIVYAAAVTIVLLVLVQKTIGFRLDENGERAGLDHTLHGEHGYGLINPN
jgi:ammonium transporter, Amt family